MTSRPTAALDEQAAGGGQGAEAVVRELTGLNVVADIAGCGGLSQ